MGVHGLTTFIDGLQKSDQANYMEKHYMYDQPVVIDGCNLMYHLYFGGRTPVVGRGLNKSELDAKKIPKAHLYGGDWIQYAQNVRYFFQQLKHCRIVAVVIFDGAYDSGKLQVARNRFEKTVAENVKRHVGKSSVQEPGTTYTPVFLKNVFLEVLSEQKVPHYQTIGEADPTIAMVAKLLGGCVILSSDSDFYIYADSLPISLKTLKFAQKQQAKSETTDQASTSTSESEGSSKSSKKVWVLVGEYVSLIKICEKEFGLKNKAMFPLAAVIIGNDSIMSGAVFKSIKQGDSMKKRIESVLKWLARQKSVAYAFKNLVSCVPLERRRLVGAALRHNLEMYKGEDGEKRVWERIKEDVDLSRWIDVELENKICKPKPAVAESSDDSDIDNFTVSFGSEENIKCVLHQHSKKGDLGLMDEQAKISVDDNGNLQAELLTRSVPDWYRLKHINCEFQTYLLNIVKNFIVFLPPQVEMCGKPPTHEYSIQIIKVTAGILLSDTEELVVLESFSKGRVSRIQIRPTRELENYGTLPSLKNHKDLSSNGEDKSCNGEIGKYYSHEKRLLILHAALRVCELSPETYTFFDGWPAAYRIWIVTLAHYVRMTFHVDSATEDPIKRVCITTAIFLCIIKNLIVNPGKISGHPTNRVLEAVCSLLNITATDPVKLQNIRQFYQRFEEYTVEGGKGKAKRPSYDIEFPHSLSRYLCIVYHTEMLNNLLGNPLKSPKVRYTIHNYFICNFARYLDEHVTKRTFGKNFNDIIKDATGIPEIDFVLRRFYSFCYNMPKNLIPDEVV